MNNTRDLTTRILRSVGDCNRPLGGGGGLHWSRYAVSVSLLEWWSWWRWSIVSLTCCVFVCLSLSRSRALYVQRDACRDLDGRECLHNKVRVEISSNARRGGGGGGSGGGGGGGRGYGGGYFFFSCTYMLPYAYATRRMLMCVRHLRHLRHLYAFFTQLAHRKLNRANV